MIPDIAFISRSKFLVFAISWMMISDNLLPKASEIKWSYPFDELTFISQPFQDAFQYLLIIDPCLVSLLLNHAEILRGK